jgi:O-acetyl-ADP-ribose deacetylase (regulator of RNase III)
VPPLPALRDRTKKVKMPMTTSFASSNWGGMDAGQNMMYPVQVLDGCVHAECGPSLLRHLQSRPDQSPFVDSVGQAIKCPIGTAVLSPTFGALCPYFGNIIHTVAPFQNDLNWEKLLESCYLSCFRLAWKEVKKNDGVLKVEGNLEHKFTSLNAASTIATTLIGAGCRGITIDNATRVAACACAIFDKELEQLRNASERDICIAADERRVEMEDTHGSREIHFILREEMDCQLLTDHLKVETMRHS